MKDYKTAEEIFKEMGYDFVKGWIAELEKRNITLLTDREMRAKELVESWEWVQLCGGVGDARVLAVVHSDPSLLQAIANVESCT